MGMNIATALIGLAVVVVMLARRFAGEPLEVRRLVLLPLAMAGVGAYQLVHVEVRHIGVDAAVFGLAVLTAVAGGIVRGLTVRVFVRDGHVWYRYTWVTLVVWVGLLALRIGQTFLGGEVGADRTVMSAALLLIVGLSFIGESAVVGRRAIATGASFAPRSARRTAAWR
jgi:membrane protein CcdC involved in cytochrome C biogenesis